MIQSDSTYIEPMQRKGMTGAFQEKRINSFHCKPSNPYPKKKIRKIIIRIGDDVFRTISGSAIERQNKIYIHRIQQIGVLLGGEKSLQGFSKFLRGK